MAWLSVRGVLFGAAVILGGWMQFWANEYVETSRDLVGYQSSIAREYETWSDDPQLGPEGNAQVAEQYVEQRRWAAAYARLNLRDASQREEWARVMLITVSGWATVALVIALLTMFLSRYRLGIRRRDSISADPLESS